MSDIKAEFTGPIGCGKTTILAILAKALADAGIEYKLSYDSSMQNRVVEDYIKEIKLDTSKIVNKGQKVILSEKHI